MGSALASKARRPPISISKYVTVMVAIRLMADRHVGALLVLDDQRPAGIFTERDLMIKVVLEGRDPEVTLVGEVMTSPVLSIQQDADVDHAVRLMLRAHIRHLPLVDGEGAVQGMLSMRHLVGDEIDELKHSVTVLEAYLGYDGASG